MSGNQDLEERIAAFQFGQDPCSNCGFPGLPCAEKSEVKFVNGDAVCPQCGEVCDYFDTRDRSWAQRVRKQLEVISDWAGRTPARGRGRAVLRL